MELRAMRSLTVLAGSGNISQTAAVLHLSPAAVHKQLKGLESELGVRLYERVGRRLCLTPLAEALLPYVHDILAQHDSALAVIEEWKGLKKGMVRIGAGPTLSSYVLPTLLKRFRRCHPRIELFIETGHTPILIEGLNRGRLDLALLVSSELLTEPHLAVEASWDCEFVLVSNLRQVPHRCRLAQLEKYPFILFQKGSRMENLIDRYFAERGFQPRVIMRFDNAEAIKAMIRAGLGISVLPYWLVDEDIRRRTLSLVRLQEPPLAAKVALVSRRRSYIPAPVQEFAEMARHLNWRHPALTSRR
jgi:DNA-binding transcriptional LysR family regulator